MEMLLYCSASSGLSKIKQILVKDSTFYIKKIRIQNLSVMPNIVYF